MFSRTRNRKSRCRDSLGADNSQVHTGPHPIKEPISVKLRAFLISQLVKNSACNAGDPGSIPGSGRSAEEGIGYPLQYAWASPVVQLVKNLPAMWAELSSMPGSGRSPGEGKGYPLQYSGLENSMD